MKKIPTLFRRIFGENKVIDILPEITEGCEKAFLHGDATVKWDGSCCAVIHGELYRRYDTKNGKPVPEGAIKCQEEPDQITGHLPCWVKCDRNRPDDKWFWSAYDKEISLLKEKVLSGNNKSVIWLQTMKAGYYYHIIPEIFLLHHDSPVPLSAFQAILNQVPFFLNFHP